MDDRIIALQGVFGDEATHDVIEYYWVPDLWYDQPWCREPAAGCADGKRVYSEYVPHEHEFVHAVRRDGLPAVFEEGLAELFSDLGWTAEPSPREDLIDMLEASEIYGLADYSRAAHFMSFLVETHGIAPFLKLAELGDREDSYGKVRRDFEKAFGMSLDQALSDYEDYPDFPDCNPAVYTDRRVACAEPGITLAPGPGMHAELPIELDCSAEGVLGPLSGYMYIETTLEIAPEFNGLPVWLYLTGDLTPETSALLVRCDSRCGDSMMRWLDGEWPGVYLSDFEPGRYLLRVFRPVEDPGMVGIEMWQ
jgi:hypothetical protein